MFDRDDQPGLVILPWVLGYFLQLLFSYPVTLLATLPFFAVLSKLGLSGEHSSGTFFAGYEALVCLFIGPFVGWTVGLLKPSFVASGRWIWLLPAVILVPEMVSQLLQRQPIPWLPDSVFATGDNEGVGVIFGTLPTCSAVGYSFGMFFAGRIRKQANARRVLSVSSAMVAAIALFYLLTPVLRDLENSRLRKWEKVRTVIDRSGLAFSADVRLLCGPKDVVSSRAFLLRSGTYVESLERRGCSEDQLIDVNSLPPARVGSPDPFVLDRVRVLNGPLSGSEGWVLEYGLREH